MLSLHVGCMFQKVDTLACGMRILVLENQVLSTCSLKSKKLFTQKETLLEFPDTFHFSQTIILLKLND